MTGYRIKYAPTDEHNGIHRTPQRRSVTSVVLATAFDCVLIYNSTQGNKAVSVHTFGSQTVTAGTFTLTQPTNDASDALLRLTSMIST